MAQFTRLSKTSAPLGMRSAPCPRRSGDHLIDLPPQIGYPMPLTVTERA